MLLLATSNSYKDCPVVKICLLALVLLARTGQSQQVFRMAALILKTAMKFFKTFSPLTDSLLEPSTKDHGF